MPSKRSESFVNYVITRIQAGDGKAFAAKLKKAESESTEFQSCDILTNWIDLTSEKERRAFGMVGASIARMGIVGDGTISVGTALRLSSKEESNDKDKEGTQGMRLRRLFSCRRSTDLISSIRPIIHLLESKEIKICYSRLLDEIITFDFDNSRERTCISWAQDFYGKRGEEKK